MKHQQQRGMTRKHQKVKMIFLSAGTELGNTMTKSKLVSIQIESPK